MNFLNFSSDKRFADTIGVTPQSFYDIKKGKQRVSRGIVDKIVEHYPQFNAAYILSGEGDMLNSPAESANHTAPGDSSRYIAHLEEEIALLRKEKEELWTLVQRLMK